VHGVRGLGGVRYCQQVLRSECAEQHDDQLQTERRGVARDHEKFRAIGGEVTGREGQEDVQEQAHHQQVARLTDGEG
jgi:hypothetical protein